MILFAMIGFYLIATAVIVLAGYIAGRQNEIDIRTASEKVMENLRLYESKEAKGTPEKIVDRQKWIDFISEDPDGPCDATMPFFHVNIRKDSDVIGMPLLATLMVKSVDQLERALGGDGVVFDEAGSIDEPSRLKLRLVVRKPFGAADRIVKILGTIDSLLDRVRTDSGLDIRAKISSELDSPIPNEVIRHLEHTVPQIAS